MKSAIATLCILTAFCCLFFGDAKTRILRAVVTLGMLNVLLLMCAGCSQEKFDALRVERSQSTAQYNSKFPEEITVYRDSETGCEYASTGTRGLTPRMGENGKQICRKPTP